MTNRKEIIFFDTNKLLPSENTINFYNEKFIEPFIGKFDIIIPEMVYQELLYKKKLVLKNNLENFQKNLFYNILEKKEELTNDFLEKILQQPIADFKNIENLQIINPDISKYLTRIQELAINKKAPFETDSDKWFKDACICFSIINYLEQNPQINECFLCTNDKKIKEFFKEHDKVICIESFKDIQTRKFIFNNDFNQKFAEFLKTYDFNISEEQIQDFQKTYFLNIHWDAVFKVIDEDTDSEYRFLVTFDNGQPQYEGFNWYNFECLMIASTYSEARTYARKIMESKKDFTYFINLEDILHLIDAYNTNSQIYQNWSTYISWIFFGLLDLLSKMEPKKFQDYITWHLKLSYGHFFWFQEEDDLPF